jgi:hypothetical protein
MKKIILAHRYSDEAIERLRHHADAEAIMTVEAGR